MIKLIKISNKVGTLLFMNSENSKTSSPRRLLLNLADKIDSKKGEKVLYIYIQYKNNKFKIPAPMLNDKFELPDESYSISDIQDYFEYIKNMKH